MSWQSIVFFGGKEGIYAAEADTGKVVWEFKMESTVTSAIVIDNGTVFFGTHDGILRAVDIELRHEKWSLRTQEKMWWSGFAVADSAICFGSDDKCLYAADVNSGEIVWEFRTAGRIMTTPVISNGVVYFGSMDGKLYAVNLETGKEHWSFDKRDWRCATVAVEKFSQVSRRRLMDLNL